MNQLKDSSSLYLRQHADNPVDWQPWSDAAFEQAKRENKPVLLSIGYSACHWCHVMAHESFEDEKTAEVMNRLFVNIKADREERPDLDKVYQLSHQLLTGRGGGWPLTLFLDPSDRAPFFAGTYFPPQARHGLPAFSELLEKVSEWYRDNRETTRAQNQQLAEAIARIQANQPQALPAAADVLGYIRQQLEASFDRQHGGFGGAPKFPQAPLLALVLDVAQTPSGTPANDMLNQTLEVMALRGLRDPVDGGFYRYCVDGDWTIPHFEKMLYDNAQLLPLYARQARRTGDALFRQAAEGIAGWLMSDMRSQQGGFHASIDADAGGVEGGYHTWRRDELRDLLGQDYAPFAAHFGIDSPPNFEGRSWHLVQAGRTDNRFSAELEKLAAARGQRTKPATDRKILTSWNALAIAGLSRAGSDLGNESWIDAAGEALALLHGSAWKDGRLYAVTFDGVASHTAYLDDHAFLLDAGLALLQARWDDAVYRLMIDLADTMLDQFEDADDGGFWFSARDQDVPMARLRSQQDDATPSGGALAASSLLRLAALSFETRYLESARRALENACGELRRQPLAHASLARAILDYGVAAPQVLIVGKDLEESKRWKAAISEFDRVNSYLVPPDTVLPGVNPEGAASSATSAHVCLGTSCLAPVHSAEDLRRQLQQSTDGFPDHDA